MNNCMWARILLAGAFMNLAIEVAAMAETTAPAPVTSGSNLIFDQKGYFRTYTEFGLMRLNSDALKSDGQKLFGKMLSRVETYVKRLLKNSDYDWSKTDWRDVACYRILVAQMGDDAAAMSVLPTIPPARDWMNPEFDESAFDRQRIGFQPLSAGYGRASNALHRRGIYIRRSFEITEPAAAGNLTVQLSYRGGARIFINGEEIGRGNLPEGPIGPDTFGSDYPVEAYVAAPNELPPKPADLDWVGDLRCSFDQAPTLPEKSLSDYREAYGTVVNRSGWERIVKLRDRVLGPIPIPNRLLRKGRNVLAIELRSSRYHPIVIPGARVHDHPGSERAYGLNWMGWDGMLPEWNHVDLLNLDLRSTSNAVLSCNRRPPGMQAWVDDIHNRLYDRDYSPPGWPAGVVRFVGGRNGTYAAQVGVGTDKDLTGLHVVASDLVGANGETIPGSAVEIKYLVGHSLDELSALGFERCAPNELHGICRRAMEALCRYADSPAIYGELPADPSAAAAAKAKFTQNFKFFDHIGTTPPKRVPANSCQPLWLSLKIPGDAPAGKFQGTIKLQADGQAAISIPVEADVIEWRVPSPREFQTFVQSEQSPYGVAKAYNVPLWSDEHFRLIESSFRQLARIGNSWVFVPVLMNSELGNREDTMIRWIRKKDGTLTFDYSLMDRYLALARKVQQKASAVSFVIMQAVPSASTVKVLDETTGQTEIVELGTSQEATRRPFWLAFGKALREHMKTVHPEDAMFWGQSMDDVPDKGIIPIMAEATPGVGWTTAGHFRGPEATFHVAARAYGADLTECSFNGWKHPFIHLLMPRTGGSIICTEGISTPFTWRVMCDRAIYAGFNGVGRIGADYFGRTWFDGVKGGYWNMAGRASVQTLWPGETGVDSSARNEVLLEGIQEAEVRIYLEQVLDRKVLAEDLAKEVKIVLDNHFRGTLHISPGWADPQTMDITNNWQARSRRLYQAAAKVAEKMGIDVDRTRLGESTFTVNYTDGINGSAGGNTAILKQSFTGGELTVAAMGRAAVSIKLRNWSGKPRKWKAVSSDAWIVPEKPEGVLAGQEELRVVLDGKTLKDGAKVSGTLIITDAASGTAYPINISAKVDKALEIQMRREVEFWTGGGSGSEAPKLVRYLVQPVLNAPVGGSDAKEYVLTNRSLEKQSWKIDSDCDGVVSEPSAGEISPESSVTIKVVARPKEKTDAILEPVLTLSTANEAIKEIYKLKVYVIPPYQAPSVPTGDAVYLSDLDQKRMKWHMDAGFTRDSKWRPWFFEPCQPYYSRKNRVNAGLPEGLKREDYLTLPFQLGSKTYSHGLWVSPTHETIYNIEGAGFTAFAAEVGTFGKAGNADIPVNFEVYVDGKLCAQSGLMTATDEPRLLVTNNLQGAKEVRLVTRRDDLIDNWYNVKTWGDPRFVKAKQ